LASNRRAAIATTSIRLARFFVFRRLGVARARDWQAGHVGEPLDRLRERETLGLHQEVEDRPVLPRGEVVVEAFLVVGVE
jgi:hypothetical protein